MRIAFCIVLVSFAASAADLVVRNGKIVTLDPAVPQAQAVAITAGKIVAIGSDAQIAREIQPSTKVMDLGGKLAIPGFIEGHGHFTSVGEMRMRLNLRDARNWEQIVAMVGAAAREAKPGEWIVGGGWHQEKWDSRPVPNVNGFPVHDTSEQGFAEQSGLAGPRERARDFRERRRDEGRGHYPRHAQSPRRRHHEGRGRKSDWAC